MYSTIETELSRRFLKDILSSIPGPCCLIGGWSIYLLVSAKFERATGKEYFGSRDIDLGFHFDPKWNTQEFEDSAFQKAVIKIQNIGFKPESFRFVKRFHAEDGHELTEDESRHLDLYNIFNLYIDVLVDSVDPERFKKAHFLVLEEPLLARVFQGGEYLQASLEGLDVNVPTPQLLMEMKVNSFPKRTRDDKRTKDLLDLFALLLFSGSKPPFVHESKVTSYQDALKSLKKAEWTTIATMLNIAVPEARRVSRLIRNRGQKP